MLKLFLHQTKGSITVMVTLMLIPTIFFTGFLTDLARIKLYSNQAVMTADNYGEAVISEYDYLLKELYGLFAVTQDKDGKKALDELQGYIKTSFNPDENKITWEHLGGLTGFQNAGYSGFMPYKSADVTLSYELVNSSKLSNPEIMSTQIGDFMRFRIVQGLMDDDTQDIILEALDEVQNTENNADVIDKKSEFDDEAGKVLEKMGDYYDILKKLNYYPNFIKNINIAYEDVKTDFNDIISSDSYEHYRDYVDNKEAIEEARKVPEKDRTDDDKELIEKGDAYDNDPDAKIDKLRKKFDDAIENYKKSEVDITMDFELFCVASEDIVTEAYKVNSALETLQQKKQQLESAMEDKKVSNELREGIKDDIALIDKLTDGNYSGKNYIDTANYIRNNQKVNSDFQNQMISQIDKLKKIRDQYLEVPKPEISSYEKSLNLDDYKDFQNRKESAVLYKSLRDTFETGSNSEVEKAAKDKKKKANESKKNAEKVLSEQEQTTARNIPDGADFAGIGDNGKGGGASIKDLIKLASSYFKMNSFGEAGNKLLLKFYTVVYDFGMFSSRTTNVKDNAESDQNKEKATSLTGIEMGRNVNYLYQAELEYLFGGHKNSVDNLQAARNHILAFRAVVNTSSTYTISAINEPITTIRNSLSAINPILGIAVAGALRAGVAAVETAADWDSLKKGDSVILIKKDINDLTAKDKIIDLIGNSNTQSLSSKSEKKFALNYDQYLMIMTTFLTTSDQIIERTGDLITLNVNSVKKKIGDSGELSSLDFKMDNAYTAVDATCAVHLDFAVMPQGFAKSVTSSGTYNEVESFEKNVYKFTVTRGY